MALIDDATFEKLQALQKLRAEMAVMKSAADDLRSEILQELGSSDVGLLASGVQVCHVTYGSTKKVNRGRLEAMFPDVFEKVVDEGQSTTLNIDL